MLSLVLALGLLFSLLTACTSNPAVDSDSTTTTAAATASTTNAENPQPSETPNPFGKYDPPIRITTAMESNAAMTFPPGMTYEDNVWTRSLEEDLGIIVDVLWTAPGDSYETKLNLAIASNQLPDMVTLRNYSQFDRLYRADKLADLTDAFEQYASDAVKGYVFEDGGLSMGWGTIGGRLMGMPRSSVNFQTTRMVFIRRDLFMETGLSEPKTMEDVIGIARAFKELRPETVGMAMPRNLVMDGMSCLMGIANSLNAYPRIWVEDPSGKLIYGSIQPEMAQTLSVMAEMYLEGLLDPEFAVKEGGQVGESITSGQIGVLIANFWLPSWPLNQMYERDGIEWDIYPLPAMSTNNRPLKVQTATPNGEMHIVKNGYSNPEAMIKIMNYAAMKVNDPEKAETEKFHSDGQHSFHMLAPIYPMYGPLMTNFNTNPNVTNAIDKQDSSYIQTPHDQTHYERIQQFFASVNAGERADAGSWVSYKFFYGPNSSFGVQNYYFEHDMYLTSKLVGFETSEMARRKTTLEALEDSTFVEIITGRKSVDEFDGFVQRWRDLGGELIEFEVNEWWQSIQ